MALLTKNTRPTPVQSSTGLLSFSLGHIITHKNRIFGLLAVYWLTSSQISLYSILGQIPILQILKFFLKYSTFSEHSMYISLTNSVYSLAGLLKISSPLPLQRITAKRSEAVARGQPISGRYIELCDEDASSSTSISSSNTRAWFFQRGIERASRRELVVWGKNCEIDWRGKMTLIW